MSDDEFRKAAGEHYRPLHDRDSSKAEALAPKLAYADLWTPEPETALVIPGWGLCPGPAHLIAGTWYTGKTLLLMTMGLCVAAGKDLFGLWSVRQGGWTHFDHEMGKRLSKRYLQRLAAGLGYGPELMQDRIALRILPRLNLCTENAVELYCELLHGQSLCTIDPLRAAAPGQDENKSEFREWVDKLAVVSDRTGCVIVVLHHGGKPSEGKVRRDTGRGTSAIDDAVQSKWVLSAKEKGAPMHVTHEKTRELNQPMSDFYLEFVNTDASVVLAHRDPEQMQEVIDRREEAMNESIIEKMVARIEKFFGKRGGSCVGVVDDIRKQIGGHNNHLSLAWSRLRSIGRLVRDVVNGEPVWSLR